MPTKTEARRFRDRLRKDPEWFTRRVLGDTPWPRQIDILEAVRDHRRVAVRSCHGAGKSWTAARAVLWFLLANRGALAATTAPTFRQVEVLWQEIRRAHGAAAFPLGGTVLQKELRLEDGWRAFGFATNDANAFQGWHAEHILVVFDEAAGIDPDIWTAAEGVLSSAHPRFLAIGNPTSREGRFYAECQARETKTLGISAFETPNLEAGEIVVPGLVTPEWVEERRSRWGEGSPLWVSRVLGEFPEEGPDVLIRAQWVEAAERRYGEGTSDPTQSIEIAVDVGLGVAETVVAARQGRRAFIERAFHEADTMATVGQVIDAYRRTGAESIKVDKDGPGRGVYDRLFEQGFPVVGMQGGKAALDPERYPNARCEWYGELSDRLERGEAELGPDELLKAQLTGIRKGFDSRGRLRVERKDEMAARSFPSPDRADAVAMALAASGPEAPTDVVVSMTGRRTSPWRV